MNTTEIGNTFEDNVYKILEKTSPKNIEFYRGGSDRGRDIVAIYEYNGIEKTVIIECKNYSSSVKSKDISDSLQWAISSRPDLYYIWTSNYITPNTKDQLNLVSKQYDLKIAWEEQNSYKKYLDAYHKNDLNLLDNLKHRIYKLLDIEYSSSLLEYNSQILPSDHSLINRTNERDLMLDNKFKSFYLIGPSCVGKTQLAKFIAKKYYNNGIYVFWHRILVQDSDCQLKSFLESLSNFLLCIVRKNELNLYLKNHGFYLTSSLINVIQNSLTGVKCAIFIDDLHKSNNNLQLIELLIQLISAGNCKLYLIGWYDIFNSDDYTITNNIKYIDINPLEPKYIRQIALKTDNKLTELELNEIVSKSDGLPGIAEIIPINREIHLFKGLDAYFRLIVLSMKEKEKALLFALTTSRTALPIEMLEKSNLKSEYQNLTKRRLAKIEGKLIILHDKYKEYINKLVYLMPKETFQILLDCAQEIPLIYIDIMKAYCKANVSEEYYKLLDDKFSLLLSFGYDMMLLETIQEGEKLKSKKFVNIIVKKMILLERKSEYKVLENYINITKDIISPTNDDYYMWKYICLRNQYFKCDFLGLINNFNKDFEEYQKYPLDIYLQILFIIGRSYYVTGNLRISLEIYYYIFNKALQNNLNNLAIKAIHRMCIIEEKLGLFQDCINNLNQLFDSKYFISVKRQAFSFYRMSKCALGNNDFKLAIKYNDKSLELKKSLNSQRGIVFSMKLYSQIYYKSENFQDALLWSEKAFNEAQKLNIPKEIVSTGIVYALSLLSVSQKNLAVKILTTCISLSKTMLLNYRLETIIQICNEFNLTELKLVAKSALNGISTHIELMKHLYETTIMNNIHNHINLTHVDNLLNYNMSLSSILIQLL